MLDTRELMKERFREKALLFRKHQKTLTWLDKLFRINLRHHPEAIEYMKGRGITEATMKRHHVGFSPVKGKVLTKPNDPKYVMQFSVFSDKGQVLKELGFINGNGRFSFSNYVMFPIFDYDGKTIASFTGRALYPQNPIPHRHLKGPRTRLYNEVDMVGQKSVVLVEGIIDCLSLSQRGFSVVASYGTSFSYNMAKRIAGYGVESVFIAFDNDKLPEGEDPLKKACAAGVKLHKYGVRQIKIVRLPRPEEEQKMDINLFFEDHDESDFTTLLLNKETCVDLRQTDYFKRVHKRVKRENVFKSEHKEVDEIPLADLIDNYAVREIDTDYYAKFMCPFHEEKVPSLVVFKNTNRFKCFGRCGYWGGPVRFISLAEGLSARDAEIFLRYGLHNQEKRNDT